jgi:hypothetical protein
MTTDLARKTEIALRDKSHLVTDVAHQPPAEAYAYEASLWATGVAVLAYEKFGSYQGDWWAYVEFPNRERYFVHSYYGSCSGCDAFEGEFMYGGEDEPGYLHRLKDFGREYLTDCMTLEQALATASEHASWDVEAGQVVAWLKAAGDLQ